MTISFNMKVDLDALAKKISSLPAKEIYSFIKDIHEKMPSKEKRKLTGLLTPKEILVDF